MISALMATGLSLPVMANDQYYDTARVISVTPQLERVNTPQQSCQTEYIRESYTSPRSPAGAIIGGIAGGLLGSQIGRGNGRVAAAAVGAGVGAIVGDRVGNNQATTYTNRPIERCVSVDNWQTVNRGYLVAYRYNGRDYTTLMDNDPGDAIRVNVAVNAGEPVQYSQPVIIQRNVYSPPLIIERSNYGYAPPVFRAVFIGGSSGHYYQGHGHNKGHNNHGRGNRHYW
jgi:uncharacterized protein YcfJ